MAMEEEQSPEFLSRRAFLRRIGRVPPPDAERTEDAPSTSAADGGEESAEKTSDAEQDLAPEEARRRLEALGVTLTPLSEEDERLQVQCKRVGNQFGREQMRLLAPLAPRVVWLDLARTGIEDPALEIVGKMTNLQCLYLQNTAVEGPGLAFLTGLEQLEYLNLFGTNVDDSTLGHLREIESLQTVYLWQTEVSEEGIQALREDRPGLSVEFGGPFFEE